MYATIDDGTYTPGEVLEYGLESGAIDVVFENNGDVLPQSIVEHVDEVRQQIIDGELEVEIYQP